jgi:hypothetical protein
MDNRAFGVLVAPRLGQGRPVRKPSRGVDVMLGTALATIAPCACTCAAGRASRVVRGAPITMMWCAAAADATLRVEEWTITTDALRVDVVRVVVPEYTRPVARVRPTAGNNAVLERVSEVT